MDAIRSRIIATALQLAEQGGGWDAVRVHVVAREAGVSLAELSRHFGDRDAIGEGFFDSADAALLAVSDQPGWSEHAIRERLFLAIAAWLDALAPHRRIVAGILMYKLQPEHVHLQARGVARISRTVQCIREVAMLPSVGWRRELEEAVLTSIYLATFTFWLADNSPATRRTLSLLRRLLATAERGAVWLGTEGTDRTPG